ncbi:hypothetical protein LWI28_015411 [Acer negundo]|uniref:Pentatricopeptide repeat-containing protein n=1 Tax=Acer negundo TaxID=4023 RepID=A0AAD5P265_ACENE|nr:hypothetical protein LWI28_015411 [Acer negundo]
MTVTYSSLIDGWCKKGKMEEAHKLRVHMEARGVKPKIVTYNALIDGYCKKGQLEEAKRLFEEMENRGVRADNVTYNTLIYGYCKKGKMMEAHKLRGGMEEVGNIPDVYTYASLIHGEILSRKSSEALKLFSEMKLRGILPNVCTYTTLVLELSKQGRPDEALRLHDEMKEYGITPNDCLYSLKVEAGQNSLALPPPLCSPLPLLFQSGIATVGERPPDTCSCMSMLGSNLPHQNEGAGEHQAKKRKSENAPSEGLVPSTSLRIGRATTPFSLGEEVDEGVGLVEGKGSTRGSSTFAAEVNPIELMKPMPGTGAEEGSLSERPRISAKDQFDAFSDDFNLFEDVGSSQELWVGSLSHRLELYFNSFSIVQVAQLFVEKANFENELARVSPLLQGANQHVKESENEVERLRE